MSALGGKVQEKESHVCPLREHERPLDEKRAVQRFRLESARGAASTVSRERGCISGLPRREDIVLFLTSASMSKPTTRLFKYRHE